MQLTVNIQDNTTAEKILWFLKSFSTQGVEIQEIITNTTSKYKTFEYSDSEIENNWKDILMNSESDSDYYKSELYYEERGAYLMEKYK